MPQTRDSTWDKYDRIVTACEQYGLDIVARLDRPPDWTRQDNTYRQAPPDNFADYGDFVHAFVTRYKGRIQYIQIWNEPNIFPEWGNKPVDPAAYVELLKVAYQSAKAADPNVRILSAHRFQHFWNVAHCMLSICVHGQRKVAPGIINPRL